MGRSMRAVCLSVAAVLSVAPAPAPGGQLPHAGMFSHPTCSPGIVFTAIAMEYDLHYLATSNFDNSGPCFLPDLSELLGTWEMVRQEVFVGPQHLLSNVAGKRLQFLPRAVFDINPSLHGLMVQEEWGTEKFCVSGAAAAPGCAPLPANLAPNLPVGGLPVAPCRESAVFEGLVRSDVYLQAGPGPSASQPVPPFTMRASVRTDLVPIAISCPGAQTAVTCRNCASMSIGKLQMVLERNSSLDTLEAISDIGGRRLVQTYKRLTSVSLAGLFNPDGSLK